ncbi:hypothetical protein R1sor_008671 [Riccia sorocarpa]|uniref:Uncharacterized protein n=1 Tax=Riccia sorocarpa TaxID=122646 RepID=A0ABD3HXP4_9MARC
MQEDHKAQFGVVLGSTGKKVTITVPAMTRLADTMANVNSIRWLPFRPAILDTSLAQTMVDNARALSRLMD